MAAPARHREEDSARLERIERLLEQLVGERRRRGSEAALLSKRAAARRLGIGRPYLDELLAAKVVRSVLVGGRPRIPAAEVERLALQGLPVAEEAREAGTPRRAAPRRRAGGRPGIRGIDVDGL